MTKTIAIYRQMITDTLDSAVTEHFDFVAQSAITHLHRDALTGADTDLIDMTAAKGDLIGHIEAPDDAVVTMLKSGISALNLAGQTGIIAEDAIDLAKSGCYGLKWVAADAE